MENNIKVREAIWETVNGLDDNQLNTRPDSDSWSIMEVLEHLYLMELVLTKGMMKQLESGEEKEAEDKPIQLTVDRSRKVDAPSHVQPTGEIKSIDDMKEKLASSREMLLDFANNADQEKLKQKAMPHPVFGMMSLDQWIPFIGYHEERHRLQIEEIKQKLAVK
ncbi:DinB family protein [Falsibacillus pallidus]|uniref:DinB family protein n=1 Tax=Falsibacillus pallidus TaxID=493781 RepID=UPI003D98D7C8